MIGEILSGKYRIVEKIGAGGMADVYKATLLHAPHRTVAIKVLKRELEQDEDFVRRFRQEAQAVVGLSHENIVRSCDVGMQGDMQYLVLEYVEGSTLKERIREQGRLQTRLAVNYAAQVLDALAHAHERGIIHRDVKPQNIMISTRGRVKLADFGIARNLDSGTQTFSGSNVLGSAHYLSPEQAKGRQVTIESDIYSMGVTLYEMVTGQPPFEGENSVSIALKHLQEEMVPPIMRNPALPPALNDVILKATRKQPGQRYHSAKEMRQDLLRVLREPAGDFARQADDAPVKIRRSRRSRRHGILRLAAVAMSLIALFGILLLTGQSMLDKTTSANADLVPTLVGKTLEDAKNTAKLRAYTTEVVGTVASTAYPSGVVIEQTPAAGTALKPGSVISITVSAGAQTPFAPDLTGMTLYEAEQALQQEGLTRGNVEYRVSEAKLGTVFRQDPLPETALLPGDEVHLFISGEPSRNVEMIDVIKMPLSKALPLLRERGFRLFRVRVAEDAAQAANVFITQQNPAQGEGVANTAPIELTISGLGQEVYTADIAFSLDIAVDNTRVMAVIPITLGDIVYEHVVYDAMLQAGPQQNISFTAAIGGAGAHEMVLYRDGVEIRRTPVTFSYLG